MRYWTRSDINELTRLSRAAKSRGKVLDVVGVGIRFQRTPLAIFHKLTSLGLMYDPSRTVQVWARSLPCSTLPTHNSQP